MMNFQEEISKLIGKPEGEGIEYKSVLPPSRNIGQLISSFANTNGGYIILGVSDKNGKNVVTGLSEDFQVSSIVHRALDLLEPKPVIKNEYLVFENKKVYAIKVEKSQEKIKVEGRAFKRVNDRSIPEQTAQVRVLDNSYPRLALLSNKFKSNDKFTGAMSKFLSHYQGVLNIISDLKKMLYPSTVNLPTTHKEGKILTRILFSSCADNFEIYLTDLLYEIYLAKPETLKSEEQVTVKEVLECEDIQDFIIHFAKKKLSKLQRGSVKAFIADNKQIKALDAIDDNQEKDIEKILQIRHLYAHNNGIVDDKFLKYFPSQYSLNSVHEMSIDEMLNQMEYLADTIVRIDSKAIEKFSLSTSY